MRHSEFWESMDSAFGAAYSRSLAADLVIGALGSRTAADALAAGVAPRLVWDAVCDAMELDDSVRWRHREPPKRRRRG
ncbi:MAG: DUF3046 domain-containing protein [Bifidobacteriaceae bacterium]|nr:DUF3046 domain-containing protein [Bifidobacteriaceae bacterium]